MKATGQAWEIYSPEESPWAPQIYCECLGWRGVILLDKLERKNSGEHYQDVELENRILLRNTAFPPRYYALNNQSHHH